jgi:hypothetical protein
VGSALNPHGQHGPPPRNGRQNLLSVNLYNTWMLLIPVRVKLHKGADAAAHCIELCTQIAHSQGLSKRAALV